MRKFLAEYKRRKTSGEKMRPLWQIPLVLPLWLLYVPACWYVDFLDENL